MHLKKFGVWVIVHESNCDQVGHQSSKFSELLIFKESRNLFKKNAGYLVFE